MYSIYPGRVEKLQILPYTYFELWVFLVLLTLYLCEVI